MNVYPHSSGFSVQCSNFIYLWGKHFKINCISAFSFSLKKWSYLFLPCISGHTAYQSCKLCVLSCFFQNLAISSAWPEIKFFRLTFWFCRETLLKTVALYNWEIIWIKKVIHKQSIVFKLSKISRPLFKVFLHSFFKQCNLKTYAWRACHAGLIKSWLKIRLDRFHLHKQCICCIRFEKLVGISGRKFLKLIIDLFHSSPGFFPHGLFTWIHTQIHTF